MDSDPVFRVTPGAAASPVILHVPHASRRVSAEARGRLLLDDDALLAELDLMTDAFTDQIAAAAARAAVVALPWVFTNLFSRLVVDPERFPDEREEMRAVGMGAVYTRTSHGEPLRRPDPAHEAALLDRHYHPYARAMAGLVDERLAATGRAVVVDVHSYPRRALPYELHGSGPRPEVCLGTDAFHTPAALLSAARAAFAPVGMVDVNTPFAGCYVPLRHHGTQPAVAALMVELRRDVYLEEPGGSARVVRALAALVDAASAPPAPATRMRRR